LAAAALSAWLVRYTPDASPAPAALTAFVVGVLVAVMPSAGWLGATVVMAGSLILHSHPGGALLLLVAALIPVALSPRDAPAWPLAGAAPALAGLGLLTAWPALAGLAGTARRRVALAATGWLWTALWHEGIARTTTLHDAVHQVLAPLITAGTPAACGAWALVALVLPWTRLRRSPELEYVRIAAWATAVALGTVAVARLGSATGAVTVGSALLGAFVGALVALVTRRLRHRLTGHLIRERSPSDRVA
jgi:hypothetical protein